MAWQFLCFNVGRKRVVQQSRTLDGATGVALNEIGNTGVLAHLSIRLCQRRSFVVLSIGFFSEAYKKNIKTKEKYINESE